MDKKDLLEKLTNLFASCDSGADAQIKERIISDLDKYRFSIINIKRIICDIIDVVNIDKATDASIDIKSAWRLQSIVRDAQLIIDNISDFIDANKSK